MDASVFEVPFTLDDPLGCTGAGTAGISRPRRDEKVELGFPRI